MRTKSTTEWAGKQPPPLYGYICTPDGKWRVRCLNKTTGYMYFCVGKQHIREHRWLWEQWHGPIPEGYVVHHKDETFAGRSRNTRDNLELKTIGEHVADHQRKWLGECAIDGCGAEPKSRGLCKKHYWDAYLAERKDDPEYQSRQREKSKRWTVAHPDRTKEIRHRSNKKRYPKEQEARCAASRAYYHTKMQDPEWREKERLRAAAKNARVAAKKQAEQAVNTHAQSPDVPGQTR